MTRNWQASKSPAHKVNYVFKKMPASFCIELQRWIFRDLFWQSSFHNDANLNLYEQVLKKQSLQKIHYFSEHRGKTRNVFGTVTRPRIPVVERKIMNDHVATLNAANSVTEWPNKQQKLVTFILL